MDAFHPRIDLRRVWILGIAVVLSGAVRIAVSRRDGRNGRRRRRPRRHDRLTVMVMVAVALLTLFRFAGRAVVLVVVVMVAGVMLGRWLCDGRGRRRGGCDGNGRV